MINECMYKQTQGFMTRFETEILQTRIQCGYRINVMCIDYDTFV